MAGRHFSEVAITITAMIIWIGHLILLSTAKKKLASFCKLFSPLPCRVFSLAQKSV